MSENRTQAQADLERKQRELRNLAEVGLTNAEASLFHVINYGTNLPPADLVTLSTREYYAWIDPHSVAESRAALDDCLEKGWLQIIDRGQLRTIAAALKAGGVDGPVYDYPSLNGVEFTAVGAQLWKQLCALRRDPGAWQAEVVVHRISRRYCVSHVAALECYRRELAEPGTQVIPPVSIGPWRHPWWRRFPEGFVVESEWRYLEPTVEAVGELRYSPRQPDLRDTERLRNLAASRQLTLPQWLVMDAVAFHPDDPWSLCKAARRRDCQEWKPEYTMEECQQALEQCLQQGWLRIVTEQDIADFVALAQREHLIYGRYDSARPTLGSVEFTTSGAELYSSLAADWEGENWLDVEVEQELYREEHQYFTFEIDWEKYIAEKYDDGVNLLSWQVTPLGPWCVHWWEVYPSGFRLELKLQPKYS